MLSYDAMLRTFQLPLVQALFFIIEPVHEISNKCGMCNQQSLRSACAYAQSDQSLSSSLEYSMIVKLLTEHHLEFLSLFEAADARPSLPLSKYHIVGNHMHWLICFLNGPLYLTCMAWSSTVRNTCLSKISRVGFWLGPGAGVGRGLGSCSVFTGISWKFGGGAGGSWPTFLEVRRCQC